MPQGTPQADPDGSRDPLPSSGPSSWQGGQIQPVRNANGCERGASVKKNPRVGFQGELGAFSQEAVRQLIGDDVRVVPLPKFEDVFRALDRGETDAAVIPIENT